MRTSTSDDPTVTLIADTPIFDQLVAAFYGLDEPSEIAETDDVTTVSDTNDSIAEVPALLAYNAAAAYVGMTRGAWSRVLSLGVGPVPDVENTYDDISPSGKPYTVHLWAPSTLDAWMENRKRKVIAGDVPIIRQRRARGATLKEIAETFGVSQSYISHILAGRRVVED